MPTHELTCQDCGYSGEFFLNCTISEFEKCKTKLGFYDVASLGAACPKCDHMIFTKMITAHGASPSNWSKWSRKK